MNVKPLCLSFVHKEIASQSKQGRRQRYIAFEGKSFYDLGSGCFFHRRSDEMISSSALRQCPANRRRLRLSVSEKSGGSFP